MITQRDKIDIKITFCEVMIDMGRFFPIVKVAGKMLKEKYLKELDALIFPTKYYINDDGEEVYDSE